jgi:molybdopterin/thiamine biosynthesis adenylyltransferase
LIVRDIPYLDSEGKLKSGAIVSHFVLKDGEHVEQRNHQVCFAGSPPYGLDGKPIPGLGDRAKAIALSDAANDVIVKCEFSMKLKENGSPRNYKDFYEKIDNYVTHISGPAITKYPNATPLTFRSVERVEEDGIFKIQNTMTSLAEINDLSTRFENEVVAVIGLGGTGAYVLDFIMKTPVKEVRGFDGDRLFVHNVFRSPGRFEQSEFDSPKAEVYKTRYDNLRNGIVFKNAYIDETSADLLEGVTFAFVCVDKGASRAAIFDLLIKLSIPFIDVGMGLHRRDGALAGMTRTTYYSVDHAQEMRDKELAPETDAPDDEYRNNIQTSELNALNASLAVIRYKQLCSFYFEQESHDHLIFGVETLWLVGLEDGVED